MLVCIKSRNPVRHSVKRMEIYNIVQVIFLGVHVFYCSLTWKLFKLL